MNGTPTETPAYLPIFEINLIKEYAERLRRRQRMARVGMGIAVVIFLISAVFVFWACGSILRIQRARTGISSLEADLQTSKDLYTKLDGIRTEAAEKIGEVGCLLPISQRRVEWAPKLAALGNALPHGMSIHKIDGTAEDLFVDLIEETKSASRRKSRKSANIPERNLSFSLIYLPLGRSGGDPMNSLLGALRSSESFMNKMGDVQIERTERSTWDAKDVILYTGTLTGATETP